MKILKSELLKVLRSIKPGLSKIVSASGMSDSYVFNKHNVFTYNEKLCVVCPFKSDLNCSVKASEFINIIDGCHEEVEITQTETSVKIESKKSESDKAKSTKRKAELAIQNNDEIVKIVQSLKLPSIKRKLVDLPANFAEALQFCIFSASKDVSTPELTCLYITPKKIISSDDFRISRFSIKVPLESGLLIPSSSATQLVNYDVKKFYAGEEWAYFQTEDDIMFCTRTMSGEYPDYDEDFKFDGKEIVLPDGLQEVVRNITPMVDGEFDLDKRIQVDINGSKLIVRAEKEIGWVEDELKMFNFKGKAKFVINPIFFKEILQMTKKAKITENKILFTNVHFEHLVSLFNEDEE